MDRYYRFAGVELTISLPDERACSEERHLAPFAVEKVSHPHVFRFEVADVLPPPEGECIADESSFRVYRIGDQRVRYIGSLRRSSEDAYIRVCHRGMEHDVQLLAKWFPAGIGNKTILNSIEAEHLIASVGGFVFHCSYIAWNGKAILFTAPSGAGKSTQAELWRAHRGARIINGDRAAVRLAGETLLAEGIPFAGSSQYCENSSLPVAAIVYLSQAPETTIRRLRGVGAFARIWEGISVNTWDNEDMERVSRMAQRAAGEIPVYHLACTPDETAVLALEQELRKLGRS